MLQLEELVHVETRLLVIELAQEKFNNDKLELLIPLPRV